MNLVPCVSFPELQVLKKSDLFLTNVKGGGHSLDDLFFPVEWANNYSFIIWISIKNQVIFTLFFFYIQAPLEGLRGCGLGNKK